jgi:hypothetical protein
MNRPNANVDLLALLLFSPHILSSWVPIIFFDPYKSQTYPDPHLVANLAAMFDDNVFHAGPYD